MPSRNLSDFVKAYDVRGLVPEQLDVDVAWALGAAFAEVVIPREHAGNNTGTGNGSNSNNGTGTGAGAAGCVIGHDMRATSPELSRAFAAGVTSRGIDVIHIGLASTDGLYFASGRLDLAGAMFTASHNPAAYNGIKLCRPGARPVGQDSGLADVRDLAQKLLDGTTELGRHEEGTTTEQDLLADYASFLRGLVDLSGIRPLKVVVDAGNGMGGHTVPAVLETAAGLPALPLEIVPLYFELDGTFPNHEANPLEPENLRDLQAAVTEHSADLGLAFDGDADRCFVIDERGKPVSPSAITSLIATREVAREVAAGTPAHDVAVVHNVITSAQVPEVITGLGARAVRTRVGHSFIKGEMARANAVFGGEHSAHYYFRDFWFADTGMLAAMHVLAALGEQSAPLSEIMTAYSAYFASGEINSTVDDQAAKTALVRKWARDEGATVDELDGLTLTHAGGDGDPMWWLNLRASNTEPLLRLNVEAADAGTMTAIRDDVLSLVRGTARGDS